VIINHACLAPNWANFKPWRLPDKEYIVGSYLYKNYFVQNERQPNSQYLLASQQHNGIWWYSDNSIFISIHNSAYVLRENRRVNSRMIVTNHIFHNFIVIYRYFLIMFHLHFIDVSISKDILFHRPTTWHYLQ
jgi:hypothetical protein